MQIVFRKYMLEFDNNFYIKNIEFNGKCSILNVSFIFILLRKNIISM
jgi:hypothetical protein